MSGAHFRIDQAANPIPSGTVDTARVDIWTDRPVTLNATDFVTGTPVWTLLSGPLGASLTLSGSTTNIATLAAPKPGSYDVEYLVGDGIGANRKKFVLRVTRDTNGLLIDDTQCDPAFGEEAADDNSGGNLRGWDARTSALYSRILPNIANVAALLLRTGLKHTQVHLLGYYTTNDGGGGILEWNAASTATHNGGTVFQPGFGTGAAVATGRWHRQAGLALNPLQFGAKADGTTDDYAAILACYNAVLTNVRGRIHFPFGATGTYAIGTTWTIQGGGFTALRVSGDCGNVTSGVSGVKLKWIGANDATMVHIIGTTGVRWDHLDFDCNAKAKTGPYIEGNDTGPVGTSDVVFSDTLVFNPRDVAGAMCWAVGNVSGIQCDTLRFVRCTAYANPGSVNVKGFVVLGGGNTKDIVFDHPITKYCWVGIDWSAPSGQGTIIDPIFVGIPATGTGGAIGTAVLSNGGNIRMSGYNLESCSGRLLRGAGGSAVGSFEIAFGQANCVCPSDDALIDYQAGFLHLRGNYFRNLRGGSGNAPKVIVNSGYGYANANMYGLESVGNHYVDATGPYIPVVNESGTSLLTAANLSVNPGPFRSFGDSGSSSGVVAKFRPIDGRMPDYPQYGSGILSTSSAGVVTSSALGGDVTGTAGATTVIGLTGTAGTVAVHASTLNWDEGSLPTFSQTRRVGDNAPKAFLHTLQQPASAATGANQNSPYATWNIPIPTGAGVDGQFQWQHRGANTVSFARDRLILGNTSTVTRTDNQNATGGIFVWTINATNVLVVDGATIAPGVNNVLADPAVTPVWGQSNKTGGASTTGKLFTFHAQDNSDTTSIGGSLDIRPGSGTSTGGIGTLKNGAAAERFSWRDNAVNIQSDATTIKTAGVVTVGSFAPATIQIGNTSAMQTMNLQLANIGGVSGTFGTPFTFWEVSSQTTIKGWANGNNVFASDGTTNTIPVITLQNGELKMGSSFISFQAATTAPQISHLTNNVDGWDFTLLAQGGGAGTNKAGGNVIGKGGLATGTGIQGGFIGALGGGERMLQVVSLAGAAGVSTSGVVAFCRKAAVTTTQVPSGDGVVYIGDVTTGPGSDPANGLIMWSETGIMAWRQSNGKRIRWDLVETTTASVGGASALPALPEKYLDLYHLGNHYKFPVYLP